MDKANRSAWLAVAGYTVVVLLTWIMSALGNTDGSGLSYLWLIFALFPSSFVMVEILDLAGWDSPGAGRVGLAASYLVNCVLLFSLARRTVRNRSSREFA